MGFCSGACYQNEPKKEEVSLPPIIPTDTIEIGIETKDNKVEEEEESESIRGCINDKI
jgi:hypothetical protein